MMPLVLPMHMATMSTLFPAATSASGVAADTPSKVYPVMAAPKEISRKARPAKAGFIMLWPRPPKRHLTTKIANTEPSTGMYTGTSAGRVMASSRPVTTALASLMVLPRLVARLNRYSVTTAAAMETSITNPAYQPWAHTPRTAVGSRASSTSRITVLVERLPRS